ncbi:prolyl oligopeptidase family serine peptidase [Flavihumibacter rivuli]|uniref:S9 family peptidase n=1 Tax=Flavihumibacter rivuli TaxID=2838156 RepID=UPI001BDE9BAC|nr:prolyl oligopeptidase family serine peptidase [Flavihumibacter rivuli]ULQ55754.1 prolyl oligopeptidase family serine peptidase [Flavihumibacter rivuli]
MRISPLLLLLIPIIGTAQQRSTASKVKQYTIEQFYKTVSYGGASFHKDEQKIILNHNGTGIFNLYSIDLSTKAIQPLTQSAKESFFSLGYLPGSNDFLYTADQGGNENSHIYLQSADGKIKDLTPGEKEKADFNGWNREGTTFYYSSNVRDPRMFDVYKMDRSNWQPVLLYKNEKALTPGDLSPNEQYLALSQPITTDKSELYLADLKSGTEVKLSADTGIANYYSGGFEIDNSAFYYITNEGNEYAYLVKYDMASGKRSKYFSANWDVAGFYITMNGKYHVITLNEDGRNKVMVFDHKSGKEISLPALNEGTIQNISFSPSENKMLLYVGGDRSPNDIWYYEPATGKLQQLTRALNPEINPADLVDAQVVRFKSFDGVEIPAIYYKPHQASKQNKVPALVWVHGGPGGQSRAGYSQAIQYFVNHGYAILAVNNRGSSGYGKTFYKMDNQNHGDKDLKDCVWGKKWLNSQDYIDANKIGIYGGSYGGFMCLAGIIQYPQEFAVGVNLYGVTNWIRTLRSIPPYWETFRKALYDEMGDPSTEDSVRLKSISPLFNTEKIKTPLLVLQGSNDPRVLQVESDEIVAGAKKNGVPVEYVLFPDEGHGFVKRANQIKAAEVTLAFLDKYLKGNK